MCEQRSDGLLPTIILWGGPDDGERYGSVLLDPYGICPEFLYDNYRIAATSRHLYDDRLCTVLYIWREVWT